MLHLRIPGLAVRRWRNLRSDRQHVLPSKRSCRRGSLASTSSMCSSLPQKAMIANRSRYLKPRYQARARCGRGWRACRRQQPRVTTLRRATWSITSCVIPTLLACRTAERVAPENYTVEW